MSSSIIFITIISALGWSFFDISRKKVGSLLSPLMALLLYMILSLPLFLAWTFLDGNLQIKSDYWMYSFVALIINFLANWSFIESVSRSPITLSVPMLAFVPVFSTLFSFLFLGETLNLHQSFGVLIVVTGSFLLNGKPKFKGDESGPWLMFLAALLWSMMVVFDKICLQSASVPMHGSLQTIGIMVLTVLLLRKRKLKIELKKSIAKAGPYLWLGVAGAVIGAGLQMHVISLADIGVIESVKRASNMMMTLVSGIFLFREKVSRLQLVSILILLLGTFIVLEVI